MLNRVKENMGYTLLEVMIALFIFTLLAGIATVSLKSLIQNSQSLTTQAKQQRMLIKAVQNIKMDLTHIIDKKPPGTPTFTGTNTSLEFTRLTKNCFKKSCSPLERVSYTFNAPILQRSVSSINTKKTIDDHTIFKPFTKVNFQFISSQHKAVDTWPQENQAALPEAIHITINEVTLIVPLL